MLHELWVGILNLDPVHAVHGNSIAYALAMRVACMIALWLGVTVVLNHREQTFFVEAPVNHSPKKVHIVLHLLEQIGMTPLDEDEHPGELDPVRQRVRLYLTPQ